MGNRISTYFFFERCISWTFSDNDFHVLLFPPLTVTRVIHTRVRRSSRRRRDSAALLARRRSDSALSDANRCAAAIYGTVRMNAIGLK